MDLRAMIFSPWWMGSPPPQRAQAITSRMLAGAGEWWMLGAWGRWYRCGLDGRWYLCPPPADQGVRRSVTAAPPGAGRPLVPPAIMPAGPDLGAGPVASTGLFGEPPAPQVMARLQAALGAAAAVNPGQFPLQDPLFVPGTPSSVAAAWCTILWCAGAPVATPDSPVLELFGRFLAQGGPAGSSHEAGPQWFLPTDLIRLVVYYCERLRAGDPMGAAHVVRAVGETAEALRGDPRFRPRADALAGIAGMTARMIPRDHGGVRFGEQTVAREWLRRCPPAATVALLRETAPGEHFRLAAYDLAVAASRLPVVVQGQADARHVAISLLAADLAAAPTGMNAVMPWLDPDGARLLQQVVTQPGHPLRAYWPENGTLPDSVRADEPEDLRELLAACYATDLAWCRLPGVVPPASGFVVPAVLMTTVLGPSGAGLTPWEIIAAARAHLAEQRGADAPDDMFGEETMIAPPSPPAAAVGVTSGAPISEPTPMRTEIAPASLPEPPISEPTPMRTEIAPVSSPEPPVAATSVGPISEPTPMRADIAPPSRGDAESTAPEAAAPPATAPTPRVVEAYGVTFLPGVDDIDRLLIELRRRGQWAQSLGGQKVSAASAPAVLLVGVPSSGQRRITRMIARALADAGVGDGDVAMMPASDLTDVDPRELHQVLAEHTGHTLLVEGVDTLILDDPRGASYADALYRARVEGVSDTILVATCPPERRHALYESTPELITDFRTLRLPDLSNAGLRADLASVLAAERRLGLSPEAWQVARTDLARLRGAGRLTNARLVETYLDRACIRHLSGAGETQPILRDQPMLLVPADFDGLVEELEER
jgi:hypothetical protein